MSTDSYVGKELESAARRLVRQYGTGTEDILSGEAPFGMDPADAHALGFIQGVAAALDMTPISALDEYAIQLP